MIYLIMLLGWTGLMLMEPVIVDSACAPFHADVCLAVDSSASIAGTRTLWDGVKAGLAKMVNSLSVEIGPNHGEVSMAVVTYGKEVTAPMPFKLSTDKATLLDSIANLKRVQRYRSTRTDLGFQKCLQLFQNKPKSEEKNYIIVSLTDGRFYPRTTHDQFDITLANVAAQNIPVIAAGIMGRAPVNMSGLLHQANNQTSQVVYPANYTALSNLLSNLIEDKQYCRCEPSCLFGECNLDTLMCDCPVGRTGEDCGEEICPDPYPVDMCLIVDTSLSVKKNQLIVLKTALADFGSKLNVGPDGGQFRVAAVTFGNNSEIPFTLGEHTTTASLSQALRTLKRVSIPGKTRTDLALFNCARILTEQGRDTAVQVILVFTDGRVSPVSTDLRPSLQAVRNTGANVIVLGIGKNLDNQRAQTELTRIALGDESNVFFTPNFDMLSQTLDDIIVNIEEIVCSE